MLENCGKKYFKHLEKSRSNIRSLWRILNVGEILLKFKRNCEKILDKFLGKFLEKYSRPEINTWEIVMKLWRNWGIFGEVLERFCI